MNRPSAEPTERPARTAAAAIYTVAFVTGSIVMSFEMLGSRYLNPYFGSGIYTWASLISTVLIASRELSRKAASSLRISAAV